MSMQSLELPLFQIDNFAKNSSLVPTSANTPKRVTRIEEEAIIKPLATILENSTPSLNSPSKSSELQKSVIQSLEELFPEQQYDEKDIQKAKEILGETAQQFTPIQLQEAVTKIQFLTETWLDDFERNTFDGVTLKELLHEKGKL
jgi:hypothetical protein